MTLTTQSIVLPADDRHRMSRLYEEVRIRLEEMAMITARTLKMKSGRGSAVRFCPSALGPDDIEAVELIHTPVARGCYDYREGTCFELNGAGTEARPADEGRKL